MIRITRDIGTRLLEALVPQKTASAGCAPDCWCVHDAEGTQVGPCVATCCYTPQCHAVCG